MLSMWLLVRLCIKTKDLPYTDKHIQVSVDHYFHLQPGQICQHLLFQWCTRACQCQQNHTAVRWRTMLVRNGRSARNLSEQKTIKSNHLKRYTVKLRYFELTTILWIKCSIISDLLYIRSKHSTNHIEGNKRGVFSFKGIYKRLFGTI